MCLARQMNEDVPAVRRRRRQVQQRREVCDDQQDYITPSSATNSADFGCFSKLIVVH